MGHPLHFPFYFPLHFHEMKKIYHYIICVLLLSAGRIHAQPGSWSVDASKYQYNMTVLAELYLDGVPLTRLDNQVGVFYNEMLRGYSAAYPVQGKALFFLTLYSNQYKDEVCYFKVFVGATQKVYESGDQITFRHNRRLGETQPVPIHLTLSEKPVIYSLPDVRYEANSCADVLDVQASDNTDSEGNGLVYSISGGADQSKFSINPQTGVLSWDNFSPDFNVPGDANSDNRYEVQVRVEDSSPSPLSNVQDIVVEVVDNTPPDPLICPANKTVNTTDDGAGTCTTTVAGLLVGGAGSLCGVSTLNYQLSGATVASGTGQLPVNQAFSKGTTTVQFSRPGAIVGNCSFTVLVKDNEKPQIGCPADQTVSADGNCSGTIGIRALDSKSDNCTGTVNEAQSPDAGTALNGHNDTKTVTLTATDVAGNSTTCSFTVTLKDVTKPIINCPADQTVAADGNCSGTIGAYALLSKSDNCSTVITEGQSPAASTSLNGHNDAETVTLTATDAVGNSTTCSFTVTLKDVAKPIINCPADQTVAADGNCSGTIGVRTLASKSDNCNGTVNEEQSPAASTPLNGHNDAETVTLTATDAVGNSTTCSFTVTLKDVAKPSITCPADQTVAADGNCGGTVGAYALLSKSDNCSTVITEEQSPAASTPLNGHNDAETVTLTATDVVGNSTTCSFTVTLKDGIKPSITCPADVSVASGPFCTAIVGARALASKSDNCSGLITEEQSPAANTVLDGHNDFRIVTLTATDAAGNSQTCTFKVTARDDTPPGIACPANRTVNTDAGQCSSVQTYSVTATENCSFTLTQTNGLASGSAFPLGLNVVNWRVTDVAGNSTICSFSITVTDKQAPAIGCPNNITVNASTGQCTAVVNYSVSGSDNCSGWSLSRTSGLQSGAQFPTGTTTVTWRNTDTGQNSTSCSFTVTVQETQLPTISCPANITANAATGLCTANVTYATPTASDNCTTVFVNYVSGGQSGTAFNKGLNTIIWRATDQANNSTTCSFSITVNDTQLPGISCPVNITANTATTSCTANVTFGNATATDNCSPVPTVTQISGEPSGSSFAKGTHTLAFRATDGVGLTRTCTFRITVVDNVRPTINCPTPIVKNTDNNLCTAVVNYTVTGADNCGSVSVTRLSGLNTGSAFPRGTNSVIWRATDIAGNSTLCSFTVTVNDAQLPGISCPANINTTTAAGQCNKVVFYTNPTATDNCTSSSANLFSGLASGSVFLKGTNIIVWRAIDNSANTSTCSFTVTVVDNELPLITCPPSLTVTGSGSPCGYPSNQLSNPSASDNCAVTSLTSNAPASLPAGPTVLTWTAKDAANNLRTCSLTVTVNCGTSAMYEVGSRKDEERDEVGRMKDEAERESTHNSSLRFSPNPASDVVVITLSNQQINSTSNQQLVIHDALGRVVWHRVLIAGTEQIVIDLTEGVFAEGHYQVNLRTDSTVITKPLVVSRR